MSQAGYTPIQLYYSATAAATPSAGNLAAGELAVNITDGKLFYKDNGGVVRVLATAAGSAGDVVGPGSSTDNALVRFDGTTGKLVQNSAGVLDDSGNLTGIAALTTSGALTLNGGTANGVTYLNGSKVLTSGSALTFDGAKLTSGAFGNTGRRLEVNGSEALFDGAGQFDLLMGDGGVAYMSLTTTNDATALKIRNYSGNSDIAVFERTTGNVGIGTSSPSAKLDVVGATSNQIRVGTATSEHYRMGRNSSDGLLDFYGSQTGYQGYRFGGIDGTWATINSSGNLGLGVTPSAWTSIDKAFEIGRAGNGMFSGGIDDLTLSSNAYYQGGWKYGSTGFANRLNVGTGNGSFQWYTAPSGTAGNAISFTQAMTLDASGNLVVGATATGGARARFVASASDAEVIRWDNSAGSIYGVLGVSTTSSITYAGSATNNAFAFITNNTERARIDSSGNLLLGTTSLLTGSPVFNVKQAANAYLATFQHTVNADYVGVRIQHAYAQSAQNATMMQFVDSAGNERGSIKTNGTATIYGTTSDYRLKTVIGAITGSGERIDALQPIEYEWKIDGSRTRGFLAHQFQEVYAGSVSGTKDAVDAEGNPTYQSMQAGSSEVIADLVAEIQSLRQRLAALEAA